MGKQAAEMQKRNQRITPRPLAPSSSSSSSATRSTPRALTIAGSDSGGGAGIQADLKTFAALGVHGMSAITAITAQNTSKVTGIFGIPSQMVISQIEAVRSDIGFDAVKTGMLYNSDVITAISDYFAEHKFERIVVDPVMVSKSGARLLEDHAIDVLIHKLLPLAHVVTPNAEEARVLCGMKNKISNLDQALQAAKEISLLGPQIVVIKGGHLRSTGGSKGSSEAVDVVYFKEGRRKKKDKNVEYLKSIRYDTKNTHGTGCVFASAIAAGLAKGEDDLEAIRVAKIFVTNAIKNSLAVGQGSGPVNPSGDVVILADKFSVYSNIRKAVEILESNGSVVTNLIPESRSNIGMAIADAQDYSGVIAVSGRITSLPGKRVKASAEPEFGASKHIANAILAAMRHDRRVRAAMNIIYEPEILESCHKLGLVVSSYDRKQEPPEVKRKEGATTAWGAEQAILSSKTFPDVFYHIGDFGKEPMMVILGRDAVSVAETAVKIARATEQQ